MVVLAGGSIISLISLKLFLSGSGHFSVSYQKTVPLFFQILKKKYYKSSTHGLKLIKRQNWKEIYKIPFFFKNYKTRMAYVSSLMEVAGEIQVIN